MLLLLLFVVVVVSGAEGRLLSTADRIGVFTEDPPEHLLRLLPDVRRLELDFQGLFLIPSSSFISIVVF